MDKFKRFIKILSEFPEEYEIFINQKDPFLFIKFYINKTNPKINISESAELCCYDIRSSHSGLCKSGNCILKNIFDNDCCGLNTPYNIIAEKMNIHCSCLPQHPEKYNIKENALKVYNKLKNGYSKKTI